MGVYHTVDGEVQVSSTECLWKPGDVGAELSGDDSNDLDGGRSRRRPGQRVLPAAVGYIALAPMLNSIV